MSSTTVNAGSLVSLDPSDKRVLVFDWDTSALDADVEIASSTWTITAISQNGVTALTKDQESILNGNRTTRVRLDATTATINDKYELANKIVTNETPAQTIERSVSIRIRNL